MKGQKRRIYKHSLKRKRPMRRISKGKDMVMERRRMGERAMGRK